MQSARGRRDQGMLAVVQKRVPIGAIVGGGRVKTASTESFEAIGNNNDVPTAWTRFFVLGVLLSIPSNIIGYFYLSMSNDILF